MPPLSQYLGRNSVLLLGALSKELAIVMLCEAVARDMGLAADAVCRGVAEREKLMTTGIGLGIAIPHVRLAEADRFAIGLGISKPGVSYGALDRRPVHILLMMVGPSGSHDEYLQLMARLTMVLKQESCRQALLAAGEPEEARRAFERFWGGSDASPR